jgi:hypothetical protein
MKGVSFRPHAQEVMAGKNNFTTLSGTKHNLAKKITATINMSVLTTTPPKTKG